MITKSKNHISIVTVNFQSNDFLELLADSIRRFTYNTYEFIIVDNLCSRPIVKSLDTYKYGKHKYIPNVFNEGHGAGLNQGARAAKYEYTMFVDVDCHFFRPSWDAEILSQLKVCDVIAAEGPPEKPIRPACMIMKTEVAQRYDWRDTPQYQGHRITPNGFDVAIKAYHEMIRDGLKIYMLDRCDNPYGTATGECWGFNRRPFIYHHWHGTHLENRQVDFPDVNLLKEKELLFQRIPWRIANNVL